METGSIPVGRTMINMLMSNITELSIIKIGDPVKIPSQILTYMNADERNDVIQERDNANDYSVHPLFNPKNPRHNVFGEGRSMHLLHLDFEGKIEEDRRHLFSKTLSHLARWTGNDLKNLGRTYWHKLEPGAQIKSHYDNSNGYFRKIKRYHIYLDVPLDFLVVIDGELWNVYKGKELTNAVIKFNLLDWHFYMNNTTEPAYLLVADFYPE